MSDVNKNISVVVTVIEENEAQAFTLSPLGVPWDTDLKETTEFLKSVLSETDFENLMNDYREKKGIRS